MIYNLRRFGEILCGHHMPVWMTLLVGIVGALIGIVGSYWIIPDINRQLKIDEIRSQYLLETIKGLNNDTRALLSEITKYNHSILDGKAVDVERRRLIVSLITELQWRVVDLDVIFTTDKAKQVLQSYRDSLSELRHSIENPSGQFYVEKIITASEEFAIDSYRVLSALYALAGLEVQLSPGHMGSDD